ncbi:MULTISPECIES: ABC transporter substrate-binding protein [Paraburkholderia]|uniref:Heme-binding protein A n=1 Tax=Paraburkholderia nemoris TaxID=2793076 RepID=A0ABM8SNM8_9BURK|nr:MULTISPECIES: ABC transporter substrate-binding protein [Paraburkholderia]MBK5183277.1 ABC transporter substrate-binding protein [Burkholderia sp. R-69749]MBK3814770.1 ABC transporter substrate-binding protein [Paraburkholderia aspalathi]CAE6822754.1 Heme-binding protein A [Paraburkholderia nemoris]CAE6835337.1 Heme-binding protein A [Paraburkholderia nemoris]CAE6859051.1 Heme-binding protein A [Paraburkholderia domus]
MAHVTSRPTLRRRGKHLFSRALGWALTLVIALSGLPSQAQTRGGTLNFIVTPEPTALVDLATTATNVLKVSPKVVEGLLDYDFKFQPKPSLATSWEVSNDSRKYVFHLRHGVKWHDGKPFTSEDVAYSIQTLRQVHPRAKTTFANVTDIATPDSYTVVITLSKPAPYLIKAFSSSETPVVPKHIYDGTDVLTNPANNAPIGTGPFRFVKWVRGSYIEYVRNDDYWDKGKPWLDRIVVKVINDPAARTVAFEDGSADLSGDSPVPLSDLERLKGNPKLGIETRGYEFQAGVSRIEFNLDNPVLKNPKVRQAIASALDREVIRKVIYYGYATPLASPIIPSNPYYDPAPTPYPFNVERANALLDEAGYPRKADGTRFALTVDPLPIGDLPARTAAYVKSALARVGIAITVRSQDLPAYLKRIYTDRDFDFSINGMSNLFDPVVGVARLYTTNNFRRGVPFTNGSHYSNPEIDQLFAQVAEETDEAKRKQLFSQIQRILERDLPDINLVAPQYLTLYSRAVHNHTTSPDGLSASFADVWLQR